MNMKKLVDYTCAFQGDIGFSEEILQRTQLSFPQAYKDAASMVQLSLEVKNERRADFCMLPFCHTVEAESLGGSINYGNGRIGPRAKDYTYHNAEALLDLPQIDFTTGRIAQVLKACSILREQGETVALEICGPFTILNTLMDVGILFKTWRKRPELIHQILETLGVDILRYFTEARKAGVELLCYADPTGALKILGPKYLEEVTENFTYPFLKKAEALLDENSIIQLCPKTAFALIGLEKAVWEDMDLPEGMSYGKACRQVRGKANFVGQTCLKNTECFLESGKIKIIKLQ